MKILAHITATEAVRRFVGRKEVLPESLASVGFIHLCEPDQLERVMGRFFANQDDLAVLLIDADRLGDTLKYEPAEDGTGVYPHLYAPIPARAVLGTLPIGRDADGGLSQALERFHAAVSLYERYDPLAARERHRRRIVVCALIGAVVWGLIALGLWPSFSGFGIYLGGVIAIVVVWVFQLVWGLSELARVRPRR